MNPEYIIANRKEWILSGIKGFDKALFVDAIESNGHFGISLTPLKDRTDILPPYKEGDPYLLNTYYMFDSKFLEN